MIIIILSDHLYNKRGYKHICNISFLQEGNNNNFIQIWKNALLLIFPTLVSNSLTRSQLIEYFSSNYYEFVVNIPLPVGGAQICGQYLIRINERLNISLR